MLLVCKRAIRSVFLIVFVYCLSIVFFFLVKLYVFGSLREKIPSPFVCVRVCVFAISGQFMLFYFRIDIFI